MPLNMMTKANFLLQITSLFPSILDLFDFLEKCYKVNTRNYKWNTSLDINKLH